MQTFLSYSTFFYVINNWIPLEPQLSLILLEFVDPECSISMHHVPISPSKSSAFHPSTDLSDTYCA